MAILLITAIGLTAFTGIYAACRDLYRAADEFYDRQGLFDLRILSTMGLTQEDLTALKALDAVADAEGSNGQSAYTQVARADRTVRVNPLGRLDRPHLQAGALPRKAGEIAVTEAYLSDTGKQIGDQLGIRELPPKASEGEASQGFQKAFARHRFTITGTVLHPLDISNPSGASTFRRTGETDYVFFVSPEDLPGEIFTSLSLTLKGAASLDCYGEDYRETCRAVISDIENGLKTQREEARYREIYQAAEAEVLSAESEMKQAFREAEAAFAQGHEALDAGKAAIAQGRANAALPEGIDPALAEGAGAALSDGVDAALPEGIDPALAEGVDPALAEGTDAASPEGVDPALSGGAGAALPEGTDAALSEGADAALSEGAGAALSDGAGAALPERADAAQLSPVDTAPVDTAPAALAAELAAVNARLDAQEAQLLTEERALLAEEADFSAKRREGEAEIARAYEALGEIRRPGWYVQDRSALPSYGNLDTDLSSIDVIGKAFPVLFLVVAILISLTTMTRMVEEELGLIGTYKAMGYKNFSIGMKYILYALSASLLGSLLGNLLGFLLLPKILVSILEIIYILPDVPLRVDLPYALLGSLLFILSILLATALSCRRELRRNPAAIMRPKAPLAGKRIFLERIPFVWRRMKFLDKVTARNLFRYKKRLLMTVVGIAGCTALVLAGFAIKDSVEALMPRQYERIYHYDAMVVAKGGEEDSLPETLAADPAVTQYALTQMAQIKVHAPGRSPETVQLVIFADPAQLPDFLSLLDLGGEALTLPQEGVLLTQNAAEILDRSPGDFLTLETMDLSRYELPLAAVTENYLGNYVFMDAAQYAALGETLTPNSAYLNLAPGTDPKAFTQALGEEDFVLSAVSVSALREQFGTDFVLLNYVIYIIILLSAGLAFAVLFTLSNTNISERQRELATIKVLGFYDEEVHSYVNKETLLLTRMGILAGLPLGYVLSGLLLGSLKLPALEFPLTLRPMSYLLTSIISFSFSLMVNLMTNRTLNRIDMIEALKSTE